MDGRTDRVIPIYPQTLFAGGIIRGDNFFINDITKMLQRLLI
jgi:hypothetical protein